ncbi:mediator of DNA damage checkpoint protein 1 [Fundulus heteroclitus]|uniref:mediator of DNA damage checkpoint protein 1 n=1 Tax=Fundulus heteroclitus TaxID=8078 RepID=UPI00165C7C8E|nr:mediator of DNA damage checkpoint protein 1 [Fundulus heteroclitus]XP_035991058.1 mediator of DNA damage checkpoint protein 1 [Fundulus heteroclitus]
MEATQAISDSILESEEEENEEENQNERQKPLAKLCILSNPHIPEMELPLFLGDNVLGRDPNICTLQLLAPSVSKQHATISISVYQRRGRNSDVNMEALVWDAGSMNGTRKGRLKLTPNVRYALSEGDTLVLGNIPCRYVSSRGDSAPALGDMGTTPWRHSEANARLSDFSGRKWDDVDAGSKKCVNMGAKAERIPVTGGCLSFEQTPIQPKGTLVPESDSDSEGEGGRRGDRRQKTIVSESDSHKSSPNSSAFLSPKNLTIPESEDESPITPSSSSRNGSNRRVSFSLETTNVDLAGRRQERIESPVFVGNGEQEAEEGAAKGGTHSGESGTNVKLEINESLTGDGGSTSVSRDNVSEFHLDSDTDVEDGEEEATPAGQPPNTALSHRDGDTGVSGEVPDKALKALPSTDGRTEPSQVAGFQLEGITIDSDTDADDDDDDDDVCLLSKATSCQRVHSAEPAPSPRSQDFHLDSDTDVDEEEERGSPETFGNKSDKPPTRSAPQNLHPGDTCDEAEDDPSAAGAPAADLDILSDSDTDVDEEQPVLSAAAPAARQPDPSADKDVYEPLVSQAGDEGGPADLGMESDTDVEDEEVNLVKAGEGWMPHLPAGNSPGSLVPLLQNCSTPVQLSEGEVAQMETQAFTSPTSGRYAVRTSLRAAVMSSCSDSQEDEDFAVAETQSFILQTRSCPDGFRANLASVLDSSAAKPEDRSPRGDSFQLGLSDSSHLQGEVRALAMENTQAYVSAEDEVNLEETQAYEAGTAAESDPSLEATQPYGEDEEPAACSETTKKGGCADLAFEATQAYSSEAHGDGSDDKGQSPAGTESVSPARSSTLAMAETQPALSPVKVNDPVCSVGVVKTGARNETAEHQGRHVAGAPSVAETQPMCASDGEESEFLKPAGEQNPQRTPSASFLPQTQPMSDSEDDDDGRPALSLQPDASSASSLAETQPLHVSADETQPMDVCDGDAGNEDDETLRPRKRKAKQLYVGDKESQQNTDSVSQTSETQPVDPSEDEDDDDDEDSMPRLRKRKARPLQLEDETQTLVGSQVSAAASQPSAALEEEQSSQDFTAARRRKAKPLLIEDEQTQPLVGSEAAAVGTSEDEETRLAAACDDGEGRPEREAKASPSAAAAVEVQTEARDGKSDDDKSVTRPRKSKAKQLHLQEEEETQPIAASEDSSAECQRKSDQEEVKAAHRRTRGRGNARKQEDGDEEDENAKKERPTEERGGGKVRGEHGEKEDVEPERRTERKEMINATPAKRQQRKKNKSGSEKEDQKEKSLGTTKIDPDEKPERTEEEQERRAGLEEASESKENQLRGSQENGEEAENPKGSVRARRAARRTAAAPCEAGPQQNPASAASEDFPARRTRSRSSSSNSVSSERSASAANAQESRGRGRGARRRSSSDAPQAAAVRSSRRRTTAAAAQLDREAQVLSASPSSQNRGRGGGGGGRGRKTFSHPVVVRECEQNPTVRSRKPAGSSTEVLQHGNKRKADSQLTSTSRGQQRASAHASEALVLNNEGLESNQEKISADLKSPVTMRGRTVRGRGSKAIKTEPPEEAEAPPGGEARNRRTTRTSQAQTEVDRGQKPTEAGRKEEQKEEIPAGLQRRRTSRASSTQVKDEESLPEMEEGDGKTVVVAVGAAEKRARGRTAVVRKNKNQALQETQTSGSSLDQDGNEETSQIPAMTPSRKRRVSSNSSPVAKTPRSSSASPATISRLRAGSQAYKVLFTGVVDESGERVLNRLGGAMAKGVSDMNCLVTDKVRRTVKFLCAVAKGVPVVTTQWLEKSGKAGSFLSPCGFVVKDPEQEKKFGFSLQESLRTASGQPLLQGYEIHVTKSVKPEPVHMKDIITCSGATFLPKMPTVHKPRTVVISCEEDLRLCGPAASASLPVVTAEFILTGILQQKVDFEAHALSAPAADPPPAEGRGRGRKKP